MRQGITKWLCGLLVLSTIAFNFKHVWDALTLSPQLREKVAMSFFSETVLVTILIAGVLVNCGLIFKTTFRPATLLQAICVLAVAALQLRNGNTQTAVLEIPFLLCTAVMFYLDYPFPVAIEKDDK